MNQPYIILTKPSVKCKNCQTYHLQEKNKIVQTCRFKSMPTVTVLHRPETLNLNKNLETMTLGRRKKAPAAPSKPILTATQSLNCDVHSETKASGNFIFNPNAKYLTLPSKNSIRRKKQKFFQNLEQQKQSKNSASLFYKLVRRKSCIF